MSRGSGQGRPALAQLCQIKVASPCGAPWEEMEGDEKVRFCGACQLHVYNLSAMDAEESAERLAQDSPRLCVRFYRRSDGTLLTRDCPVGAGRVRRKREGVEAAAVGLLATGLVGAVLMPTQGAVARPAAQRMALHSAAASGNVTLLRKLLDAGVDPNGGVKTGPTPLMRAAAQGQVEAVHLLLTRGADIHARDPEGRTALRLAAQARHRRVVTLLKKAGAAE